MAPPRRSLTFRFIPPIISLLTLVALALTLTATLNKYNWYSQDVGVGVENVGIANNVSLHFGLFGWCAEGLPSTVETPEIAAPGKTCRPIDVCAVLGSSCKVVDITRWIVIGSDIVIGLSFLFSLLLYKPILPRLAYTLLTITTLLSLLSQIAILIYFRTIKYRLRPEIPNLVKSLAGNASDVIYSETGKSDYQTPFTLVIVSVAIMGVVMGLTLASMIGTRCGRGRKERRDSWGQPLVQDVRHENMRV